MPPNKPIIQIDIDALFSEKGHLIDQAINEAVRNAIERHKKLSQSIAIWKDGKVIIVEPQDIDKELNAEPNDF